MGAVIGIFSPKGGVGKTLLATNLAVAFGVGHHRRTILVDLNSGTGSADLLLDLDPNRSWSDLLSVVHELTPKQISLAVTEFRSGLDLLASPPEIFPPEVLSKESLPLLLEALRNEYELVILDVPGGIDLAVGGVLDLTDVRLLLLTPDMPSLRSISRFLTNITDGSNKTGLVINQYSPGAAVSPDQIKDHLGQQLLGVLPIDPDGVWTNISFGEPCVMRRSSKLGKSIRLLSARLLGMIDQRNAREFKGD